MDGLSIMDTEREIFINHTHEIGRDYTISSNVIRDIYGDSSGRIWVGTDHGLNRYERDTRTFKTISPVADESKAINDIYEDQSRNLWISTDEGIYLYDASTDAYGRDERLNFLDGSSITDMQQLADGEYWVG